MRSNCLACNEWCEVGWLWLGCYPYRKPNAVIQTEVHSNYFSFLYWKFSFLILLELKWLHILNVLRFWRFFLKIFVKFAVGNSICNEICLCFRMNFRSISTVRVRNQNAVSFIPLYHEYFYVILTFYVQYVWLRNFIGNNSKKRLCFVYELFIWPH